MRFIFSALFGFLFLVIQWFLSISETTLNIELVSFSRKDVFQVFYDIGAGYREEHSVKKPVSPKAHQVLSFPLPSQPLKHLRIDPGRSPGEVYIQSITLRYQGIFHVRELIWTPTDILKDFVPLNQIDQFLEKDHLFYLRATHKDPYFAITYPIDLFDKLLEKLSWLLLGLAMGIFFIQPLWKGIGFLLEESRQTFVPSVLIRYSFIFVLALMMVMAVTTPNNYHPDEYHHFLATEYYITHWFPPEIGDPAVIHTYSVYGMSYLNYYWVEYLLMGKFVGLLSPMLISDPNMAARFFNIFLFGWLLIIFFHRARVDRQELIIIIPLLMTPQVWYIFSYVNNDAFPLFISLLVMSEMTSSQSSLNKFLSDTKNLNGGVFFGFLLGLLLISKQNYYIILLFVASLFFFRIFKIRPFTVVYTLLWKSGFILFVACLILIAKYTLDLAINGESPYFKSFVKHSTESKLLDYQEQVARDRFKPSLAKEHPEKSFLSLNIREKGVSYFELFSKWRWHEITFRSFVGYYGYMSIAAPQTYYTIMKILYIAFLLFLFLNVLRSKHKGNILTMGVVLLGMLGTVFISSYHSWTVDFQAQGRYLFPVISLLGFLVYQNRQALNNLVSHIFLLSLFGCSVYSFIFVALANF